MTGGSLLPARRLGTAGIEVSALGLGTLTLGREVDAGTAIRLVRRYVDAGGRLVDTANTYSRGGAEEIVGRALEGAIRREVTIATKVRFRMGPEPNDAGASRRHIVAAVDDSLRRLRTDYIDLYQLHGWDAATPLERTLPVLDGLVRSGKVLYVGASNLTAWQLARAHGLAASRGWERFQALQLEYSLTCRDAERELLPACGGSRTAAIAWAPLTGGVLSAKYRLDVEPPLGTRAGGDDRHAVWMRRRITARNVAIADEVRRVAGEIGRPPAQVALNWVVDAPGLTAALVSVRDERQLDENLRAVGWQLPAELRRRLDECSRIDLGHPHEMGQ